MANTKSAQKSHEQTQRRRVFNVRRARVMKDSVKELGKLIAGKDKTGAEKLMPGIYKAIDKAAKRGIIKKNTAARKKSRLSKKVAGIQ